MHGFIASRHPKRRTEAPAHIRVVDKNTPDLSLATEQLKEELAKNDADIVSLNRWRVLIQAELKQVCDSELARFLARRDMLRAAIAERREPGK